MGITHHSNYIRWMEEARVDFLEQLGWGYARMEANGIQSPVVSVHCDYRKPTTFGDVVTITASVAHFTGVQLEVRYVMTDRKGETVCEASSSHCFLTPEGKFIRMKKAFPELFELLSMAAEDRNAEENIKKAEQASCCLHGAEAERAPR